MKTLVLLAMVVALIAGLVAASPSMAAIEWEVYPVVLGILLLVARVCPAISEEAKPVWPEVTVVRP